MEFLKQGAYKNASLEELQKRNRALYEDVLPEHYENSYGNPAYAVKTLGEGLIVSARATDGLIEGVEMPGRRFVVGVQWHPETLSDYLPEAQALFNAFVEACP